MDIKLTSDSLNKLNEVFTKYPLLWDAWTKTTMCNLTESESYTLEVLQKKDFVLTPDDLLMFYCKRSLLEEIRAKLEANLFAYNTWLISRFQFNVVFLAAKNSKNRILLDLFLAAPINTLKIPIKLKRALFAFEEESIDAIMREFSVEDFLKADHFPKVIHFLKVFNRELQYPAAFILADSF